MLCEGKKAPIRLPRSPAILITFEMVLRAYPRNCWIRIAGDWFLPKTESRFFDRRAICRLHQGVNLGVRIRMILQGEANDELVQKWESFCSPSVASEKKD